MKPTPVNLLTTLALALCFLGSSAGAQDRTRSAEAIAEIHTKSEEGHYRAQYNLARIYQYGRGLPKDEAEAVKWYRKAAEQGYLPAQEELGVLYHNGHGVGRDETEAYKWWLLAGAQGSDYANKEYGVLERRLSPAQRAEGQKMAREFKPKSDRAFVTPPLNFHVREPGDSTSLDVVFKEARNRRQALHQSVIESVESEWAAEQTAHRNLIISLALCGVGLSVLIIRLLRRQSAVSPPKFTGYSNTQLSGNQTGQVPLAARSSPLSSAASLRFAFLRCARGFCGFVFGWQILGLLPALTWLQQPSAVTGKMILLVFIKVVFLAAFGALFFGLRTYINRIHTKECGVPHPALTNRWAM